MRILRGVSSQLLRCGCLAGVYETYDGEIVAIIDARAASCGDTAHAKGKLLPADSPRDAGRHGRTTPTGARDRD